MVHTHTPTHPHSFFCPHYLQFQVKEEEEAFIGTQGAEARRFGKVYYLN